MRGGDDRSRERMFARPFQARRKLQDFRFRKAGHGNNRRHLGFALGQGSGLVHHERIDLLHALQRLGRPDQHAGTRALTDADADAHGRCEPERAGQAMISTETAAISP